MSELTATAYPADGICSLCDHAGFPGVTLHRNPDFPADRIALCVDCLDRLRHLASPTRRSLAEMAYQAGLDAR